MIADAFALDTGWRETRALSTIWENRTDFSMKVDQLTRAAEAIVSAARNGDVRGVLGGVPAVTDACADCHRTYVHDDRDNVSLR